MASNDVKIIDDWKADLLAEKSFGQAVRLSMGAIGGKADALLVCVMAGVVTLLSIIVGYFRPHLYAETTIMFRAVSNAATYSFIYFSSVMAFILAAYSVAVTLLSAQINKELSQIAIKNRKISQFKVLHFSFIFALFVFICGSFYSAIIYILFMDNGILYVLSDIKYTIILVITFNLGMVLLYLIFYSIFLVKTVFWSVYQVVVTSLTAEDE